MKKIRVSTLREKKSAGQKIATITAHDSLSAAIAEAAEVDLILVGDSLGMTTLGYPTTLPVTLEMMIHHAAAVSRGASLPLLIGDMPFMTYKVSPEQALANAARLIQEGGMEGVKIEGGVEMAPTVARLVEAGIPVMAHIGILPQSVHAQGGFRVQGRSDEAADRLLADARALEQAGAFSIVLECMPPSIAQRISKALAIPSIGIGAGPDCDGQVLVFSDLLGLGDKKPPKFAKVYTNLREASIKAIQTYISDVREKKFPGAENTYE